MKLRSYHRTLLAGVLATLGLVGCDSTAPAGSGSLLGVDIPEEFTFQTAQDVRVSLGDLAEQKIEIRLQTGEKIYEGATWSPSATTLMKSICISVNAADNADMKPTYSALFISPSPLGPEPAGPWYAKSADKTASARAARELLAMALETAKAASLLAARSPPVAQALRTMAKLAPKIVRL